MECSLTDLNNMCRTCKKESAEMKSLFIRDSESGKENLSLDEMLMACTSVQINTEDGLPKFICQRCFVQLQNAYCFKEQCERTDVFLRDYLRNLNINVNIKEEPVIASLELISDSIGDINPGLSEEVRDGNVTDDIKTDPETQSEETQEENMNYVQVVGNNSTVYECKTCSKIFYTFERLKSHNKLHTGKIFNCKQCDKSYKRINHLHRHELSHTKRKMYVCKICNKSLLRLEHLKQHLVTHLKDKPFACPKCNRGFNRAERLHSHTTRCNGKKVYVCDICSKTFLREDSLGVHKRIHVHKVLVLKTLENLNNMEEHYTEIDFGEKADVFSDQSNGDDLDTTEKIMEPEVDVSENGDQEKVNQIAQIANETHTEGYATETLLEKVKIEEVLLIETEIEGVMEEQALETDDGKNYESGSSTCSEYHPINQSPPNAKRGKGISRKYTIACKSTGRPRGRPPQKSKIKPEVKTKTRHFECPECKLVFSKVYMLEKHAEQHGLKLYKCETCGKQFSKSSCLKRHRLSHVKSFLCMTCKKCFSRGDHLQKHMKLHLKSEVFTCDICQEVFPREETLMKHKALQHNSGEKVVMAERKFKCLYCAKSFTIERYRDLHMKKHLTEHIKTNIDNSRKFLCSECGHSFKRHDYLVVHMKRHRGEKPFKCKFCGKGFTRTTDLTQHERYHTGEKTHLCVVCGRGFGRAYNLTVHMRTHTGEKPYRCTYCDAAYAQRNDLKAHLRRHT